MNLTRYRGILLFALLIAGVIAAAMITRQSHQLQYIEMTPDIQVEAASPLNVIDPFKVAHNSTETHCFTAVVENNTFPLCTQSAEDNPIVSGVMQRRGAYFELDYVTNIVQLLRLHSTATSKAGFVDIGAFVGEYSIAAAHSGYHVIALEPNMKTMRHLAASVVNGNIQERIVLLNNAAKNVSGSTLFIMTDVINPGDTRVIPEVSCTIGMKMAECRHEGQTVRTITLNNLLLIIPTRSPSNEKRRFIMKVDAQGSEVDIFNPIACSRFLDEVEVMAIQMEWNMIQCNCADDQEVLMVNKMLSNLYDRKYEVHDVGGNMTKLSEKDWRRWPGNIMFKKSVRPI